MKLLVGISGDGTVEDKGPNGFDATVSGATFSVLDVISDNGVHHVECRGMHSLSAICPHSYYVSFARL